VNKNNNINQYVAALFLFCVDGQHIICAGMTNPSVRKPAPRHSHEPTSRHYHAGGNLGRRVKKTYIPSFLKNRKPKSET
ncbi:hypothetical protein, partial [Neisseria meningitidis]|uniref:hypothetical protein n=1 Tax=Neisseria meningitidis TaxID=487 RepID=UPI001E503A2E